MNSFAAKSQDATQHQVQFANLEWWQKYNDPILLENLNLLYKNNHDLKIATLKVKEGENLVKISFSNELPQLGFSGQLARVFTSSDLHYGSVLIPDYAQNNFYFPLTMNYELDVWGKSHLRTKSVKKQLEMMTQEERASYIVLSSAFAADYFNLVKVDKLIELQKELVATQTKIVESVTQKHKNGLCPVTVVLEEDKALTFLQEELNGLEEKQDALLNQMTVYLSEKDVTALHRAKYDELDVLQDLPQKIPSDAINNRPDFVIAEKNLQKVGYDVKVAKKNLLPRFVIVGQMGFNAYSWSRIFSSNSQLANAGILPIWDVFTGGRKVAILKLRKNEYDEAVQTYEKTVLSSLQEINDSLVSMHVSQKNYDISLHREGLEQKEFDLMHQKNVIGSASDFDTLAFHEKLLLAKKSEVSNKINCLISSINLYKAVGGKNLYSFTGADL